VNKSRNRPVSIAKRSIHAALGAAGYEVHRKLPDPYGSLRRFDIRSVIDVGANIGQFAALARRLFPSARIFSFEPIDECYRQLVETFSGDQLFKSFPLALGDESGIKQFHHHEYSPASSLLSRNDLGVSVFPFTDARRETQITVERLDAVAAGLELEPEILVKLDVQGYEDRVIDGGRAVLAKARLALVEVNFYVQYETQALFHDVYARLRELGFDYRGNLHQLRSPIDDTVLEADALFVRD
jgi:FkbM family methyltransferase